MRHIEPVLLPGIVVAGRAAFAQTDAHSEMPKGDAVMVSLFDPIYPPLASQANITGDVELALGIKNDGSIESAVVVERSFDAQRSGARQCSQVSH